MTRASIVEYVEAVRRRYFSGSKKQKGRILDEFIKVAGCHRKPAIRLIRHSNQTKTGNRRGRPRQYDAAVVDALKVV